MLEAGQIIAARYELTRPLAAGHDAATWLARDAHAGGEVVLRFRPAAAAAGERLRAVVQHPALLAPVTSLRVDGDSSADVFPYLPGGEIGRLRGRPWSLIARRLLPVVDALAAIHAAGWVHGDLKTANVLLDAGGFAQLADLGSAQRIDSTAPAAGSPYSISPERMDGAPAAAADDIYAFGVMLYELISGHPPFYPDLTPERVRNEVPAPVNGRPMPPESLRALVASCLAKHAADRPGSMLDVRTGLQRSLDEAAASEQPPAATSPSQWTPRPPLEAAPIRPQWRRTTNDAPTPQQLRKEGFRSGLLAGALILALAAFAFTSFVLPDLIASRGARTAATAPAQAPAQEAEKPAAAAAENLEELAELKRRAEERREPLPARLQALEQKDGDSWARDELGRAREELAAGDAAQEGRDFRGALQHYEALAAVLDALERRAAVVLKERLASAQQAFDAGRSSEAREMFAAALRIDTANAAARQGIERSGVLDEVLRETSAGARAEQAGNTSAAEAAYQRALKLDPATVAAREGLARLRSRATGDAFAAAIAQAQTALARRDYGAARSAFERADKIRPGTPEVAEGLQQVRRATETDALASTVERALAAERAELWSEALRLYREALRTEPSLRAAQEGAERADPRAMLDAELQSFIDRPERLYSPSGRDVARNVIERAGRVPAPGTRLQGQLARMQEMLRQAETPIRIALASDNATDVQIYRVGKLGLFERRDLELMPGRYTVVGTRQGYRDVRKELNVLPGSAPPMLVVRCEEPI